MEKQEKKKKFFSRKGVPFRKCLFAAFLCSSLVPLLLLFLLMKSNVSSNHRKEYTSKLQMSCYLMGQRLTSLFSYEKALAVEPAVSELEHMTSLFDARIILVDSAYKVLYDTYHLDEQRYLLEPHILEASAKKKVLTLSEKKEIRIFQPIFDSNGEAAGVMLLVSSLDEVLKSEFAFMERSLMIAFLLVLVAVGCCYLLAYRLSGPLVDMKHSTELFRNGQSRHIQADGYTELIEMSGSINEMIEKLNAIDASRKEFVSNVSHELKTPITSIRILADSLLAAPETSTPSELYREFMTDISEELDRETKIINDLLAMVKLDETAVKLNMTNVDINALLELLLKRLQPIAEKQEVELVLESFRQVTAQADEVKLTRALSNLIENAIKYNVKDGWVHVSLNADHQFLYIKIVDSGIGIPQEEQSKIFERFYRVDKARSRETGGTGLGLALTKSIIQLHRGEIRVYSKENEGTTFTVRLPLTTSLYQGHPAMMPATANAAIQASAESFTQAREDQQVQEEKNENENT